MFHLSTHATDTLSEAPTGTRKFFGWRRFWGAWARRAAVPAWTWERLAGDGGLRRRVASLREREKELAMLAERVERKFVTIGEALQRQAAIGSELVEQSARLLKLAGADEEEPAPVRAGTLVEEMLKFAEDTGRRTSGLIGKVEGYHAQIGRLLTEEKRVERIVAPLRVIQTLFRIESAVLPVDVQVAFVALSGEIPKFEAKVREAFAQHGELLTQTRERIETTTKRLREKAAQQAEAVADSRERKNETLAAMHRELGEGQARDARLAELLGEIDREASGVIVSLQYQDITRQKMEHVRAALAEIVSRGAAKRKLRTISEAPYLHQACRLEALQAQAIHEELERAVATLLAGVRGIVGRLDSIERECRPQAEFGRAGEIVAQRMRGLAEAVREAEDLMPQAAGGAADAAGLMETFGDVAASVAAAASDMAEDMRMIALNAQVQAAQAGEAGAGLLILAERTYLISEEIKLVTRNIGVEFAEAQRLLTDAIEEGRRLGEETEARQREIAAATAGVRGELESYAAATAGALSRVEELLVEIGRQTAEILPELDLDETFAQPLLALRDELEKIVARTARWAGSQPQAAVDAESFVGLRRRYTMDSERAVHAAAFADGEGAPENATASPAAGKDANNVELF